MSLRRAAWLVARREFTERIRSRAFQIATAITVAVVGAAAILAGVIGDDDATTYDVGVQGTEAFAIGGAARAAAPAFDLRVELRPFPSAAAARAAVRDESVDAALVRGAIVTRDEPQDDLEGCSRRPAARSARARRCARRASRPRKRGGRSTRRRCGPRCSRERTTAATRDSPSLRRCCSTCS